MKLFEINRHVNVREDHHHTHQVTEQRAPTDESVRLLREMEAAARQAITDAVRVDDCVVDIVVHTQDDLINAARMFAIVYSVNGTRRDVRVNAPMGRSRDEIASQLIAALSVDLAETLLAAPMRKALGRRNYEPAA